MLRTCAAAMLAAVVLAGCGESAVEPTDSAAAVEASLVQAEAASAAVADHGGSALDRLFRAAVHKTMKEQGREAAMALVEPVRAQLMAAREAHQAGNREEARQHIMAARAAQAAAIVEVLGAEPAAKMVEAASRAAAAIQAKLAEWEAAGRDVTRLREALAPAFEATAAATRALEAGQPAAALERAAFATEFFHRMLQRLNRQG